MTEAGEVRDKVLGGEGFKSRNPKKGKNTIDAIISEVTADDDWMRLGDSPPQKKSSTFGSRGRGKLIMLDDLLLDHANKQTGKKPGRPKNEVIVKDNEDSDDNHTEEDDKPALAAQSLLEQYENEMIVDETVLPKWGVKAFGLKRSYPEYGLPECEAEVLKKFKVVKGEAFLIDILVSTGLFRSWIILEGRCEEATVRWIFNQMAFSKDEHVERASCKLLCDLLHQRGDGQHTCKLEWLPTLSVIMETFKMYGFVGFPENENLSGVYIMDIADTIAEEGPPPNLRSVLQFLLASLQAREQYKIFSASEAEEFLLVLAQFQLDRSLVGISSIVRHCFMALIDFFTDEEWSTICPRVATSFARTSLTLVNGLRVAKCLQSMDSRINTLQQMLALELLSASTKSGGVITDARGVLSIFKAMNTKAKTQNFTQLYDLLILADLYLWLDVTFQQNKENYSSWLSFLKKCALHIFSGDERPNATKVRNLASFLWQKYQFERD